jgi:galactokinase/mevalonate kinase-like predicted kinase
LIISKTPLRLTLGGGGTDLPSYSSKYGGFVVTSALDKYVYLMVKRRFEEEIRVSYSVTEIVKSVDDIRHPVVREALRFLGLRSHLEKQVWVLQEVSQWDFYMLSTPLRMRIPHATSLLRRPVTWR